MIDFSKVHYYRKQERSAQSVKVKTDVCIYGATSAGVAAAVQAHRMGHTVALVAFGSQLGGLSSGGLGATDIGNKAAIGGISREFYDAVGRHYGKDTAQWTFEPQVAERIFTEWVLECGFPVYYEQHLNKADVHVGRLVRIRMENGNEFAADIFIDATYEGDLLAQAGVSYHIGRESNSVYRETLNGIHYGHPNHNFRAWTDPYRIPGKPDSGLLFGVADEPPGIQGQGDSCVQAYNFRICLSEDPANRLTFPMPPGYKPEHYELLLRYIRNGAWDAMRLNIRMPNGKTDLNNYGGVSTDFIGGSYEWPNGSYEQRERMFQEHLNYNLGMLYFLSNDERVPQHVRKEMSMWGLPADEYVGSGLWTPQLYIREARRMISDVVMTESHCRGNQVVPDSIGLAAYQMDSHNCRRIVLEGRCVNEGNVEVDASSPYPISYRSIVPKGEECTNLLVPVCLSSSHIAFGSIRMEPVFMILGQSAAVAASISIVNQVPVQEVDYKMLRDQLLQVNQILHF
jgi:hypothetical protein